MPNHKRLSNGLRATVLTLGFCAMLGLATPAHALLVNCLTATVSATGPAFGTYDPVNSSPTDVNGSVSVTCFLSAQITAAAAVTVTLSAGSSGSFGTRKMLSGPNALNYNLYADAAYSQIWGDGTSGTSTVTDNFAFLLTGGLSQTVMTTIYGQVFAQQLNVFPGSYTDTITVTINY